MRRTLRSAAGEQSHTRRDTVQNLLIVLLTLSAVALFAQTQMYSLGMDGGWFGGLSGGETASSLSAQAAGLTAPVRVAVTGDYGRYGSVTLTTGDEEFTDPLGRRLAEALGSAQVYTPCQSREFLEALDRPSLYYDFLEPLPLPVLAGLVGVREEEAGAETISARRMLISDRGEQGVLLYLWDGEEACFRCPTAVSADSLEQVLSRYELGGASFAMDGRGEELAPCSLLLETLPELPELSAEAVLTDTDWLLSGLGFNPRTRSRYTDAWGAEVIMDGNRSLRIRTDGSVRYQGGGGPGLSVEAAGETPTLWEAAQGAGALLSRVLVPAAGEAVPCLTEARQNGNSTVLRFGLQVGGVPVRLPGGAAAAEVTLSGTSVSKLTLSLRRYTAGDGTSLLLPVEQALAIAARTPGAELSVAYADSGGDRVRACWIAD